MLIVLLLLVLTTGQIYSFDRHLGLIIPSQRVVYPRSVNTSQVKIVLPGLDNKLLPVEKNIDNLIDLLSTAELFKDSHSNVLWPLYDLRLELDANSKLIKDSLLEIKNLTEPGKVGVDIEVDKELLFEVGDYFYELISKELSNDLIKLNPLASMPSPTRAHTTAAPTPLTPKPTQSTPSTRTRRSARINMAFRTNEQFLEAVKLSTVINQNLKIFSEKLNSLVNTIGNLKMGQIDGLTQDFFFREYLERQLNNSEFRIIDVPYFKKTHNKYEFSLDVALFSGTIELLKYHNIQYYNSKLSHTYFSALHSDEIFELTCIASKMCYPVSTQCCRYLRNGTLYQIVSNCPFEQSTLEFELLANNGLLLNKDPVNEDVKRFLKRNKIMPSSFPCLVSVRDCITFNDGDLSICFKKNSVIIYSKFAHDLYRYISPIWYSKLISYFQNFPLILFLIISALIIMIMKYGVVKTKDILWEGKAKVIDYIRKKVEKAEEERYRRERENQQCEATAPLHPGARTPSPKRIPRKSVFKKVPSAETRI